MFINTYLCFPGPVVLWVLKLRFHILFLDSFEIAPAVFIRALTTKREVERNLDLFLTGSFNSTLFTM